MPGTIAYTFTIGEDAVPVTPKDRRWRRPLPASRHAFSGHSPAAGDQCETTHGAYFSAARDFLDRAGEPLLNAMLADRSDGKDRGADNIAVTINLIKHGAFYHPSQVAVRSGHHTASAVLNVAVSPQGRATLSNEVSSLQRLSAELGTDLWPGIHCAGDGRGDDGQRYPMFLADWLDDHYEFHLTDGPADRANAVVIWDADGGHWMPPDDQVDAILRQAAHILAYAYNPVTFDAIRNWHHAAGDFVVGGRSDAIDVRLITVRDYSPFIACPEPDLSVVLETLALFLVAISLRLRIDRLNGIGALALYPERCLGAAWEGFRDGLVHGFRRRGLPDELLNGALAYLGHYRVDQLAELASELVRKRWANRDERDLLEPILEGHAHRLKAAICAS